MTNSIVALVAACGVIAAAAASTPVAAQQARPEGQSGSRAAIVEMTPDTIREVRQLFYDRNYGIRGLEPEQGPDLAAAIRNLQARLRRPETGILTVPELEALRNMPPPAVWGAIGYTGIGGHVGVTERPTRARAEQDAKAECERRTFRKCETLTVAANRCVALVHSFFNDGRDRVAETFPAFGDDPASAGQAALADCRAKAMLRDNCDLRHTLCADGRN